MVVATLAVAMRLVVAMQTHGRHVKSDKALHSFTQMCYSAFNLLLI